MPSLARLRAQLTHAAGNDHMVRIARTSQPGDRIDGFVLAVGRKWSLVRKTMDGGFLDGYAAIRTDDITNVRPDMSFESEFTKTLPEWPLGLPELAEPLDLDNTERMLRCLLHPKRLVAIERKKPSDATWIGVPFALERKRLYLWEVDPQARWHREPFGYALRSITAVLLDNHYQHALGTVAPECPDEAMTPPWTGTS